eukprot:scaffold26426_cov44-Cyclotella_meneghiniana.AAC.2
MAPDPLSLPPQTPHNATHQSVVDANQAAPSPASPPAPDAPADCHSTQLGVHQASPPTMRFQISANTRSKRKTAVAAQRDWTVAPSPLTLDATSDSLATV